MISLQTIEASARDGVGSIRMTAAQQRNAITPQWIDDMIAALDWMDDAGVRAVVLEAEGTVFCAGADVRNLLREREERAAREPGLELRAYSAMMSHLSSIVLRLRESSYPIVAAVGGPAVGGGANLALACDIRLASHRATFTSSFVKVGLGSAAMGGSYLWSRTIGLGRALEVMLTGREVGAEEAERIGLVTRIVEAERLAEEAAGLAGSLAELPPLAITATKRGVNRAMNGSFADALAFESIQQAPLFLSDDHLEGMRAFLERRAASFGGS